MAVRNVNLVCLLLFCEIVATLCHSSGVGEYWLTIVVVFESLTIYLSFAFSTKLYQNICKCHKCCFLTCIKCKFLCCITKKMNEQINQRTHGPRISITNSNNNNNNNNNNTTTDHKDKNILKSMTNKRKPNLQHQKQMQSLSLQLSVATTTQ